MKKRISTFLLIMIVCIMSVACGDEGAKTTEKQTGEVTTEEKTTGETIIGETTTGETTIGETTTGETTIGETTTGETTTEETTTEETTTEETTTEETITEEITTEDAKVYDVYVNGKGYDKGTTLKFKIYLKANDTEFTICCPSFNIAYEGNTNPEEIVKYIDYETVECNPLLFCNTGFDEYNKDYFYYWEYYEVLDMWNNPAGKPLDITDGIYVHTISVTFKESGKYNISVTSGNGDKEMADEFAKYKDGFTFEILE